QYYGRYVDDFVLIHPDREFLKSKIKDIRFYLKRELGLDLHPKKIYLQHYQKGVAFLDTFIKPYRTYIGKRAKHNFYMAIQDWNRLMAENKGRLEKPELIKFIATMNSYLGTLKHHKTYYLRKKLIWQLRPEFFNYVYISGG